MSNSGIVSIHGKLYLTVASRINTFRTDHPDWTIATEVISVDDERVVMKAAIATPSGQVISTGYAEEVRSASAINRTSALENAETSAVGRALAFYGLAGTEIASADEVANAIKQQNSKPQSYPRMPKKQALEIAGLVDAANLDTGDGVDAFGEAWIELKDEQRTYAPWIADLYPNEVTKHKNKMREIMASYRERNNLKEEA